MGYRGRFISAPRLGLYKCVYTNSWSMHRGMNCHAPLPSKGISKEHQYSTGDHQRAYTHCRAGAAVQIGIADVFQPSSANCRTKLIAQVIHGLGNNISLILPNVIHNTKVRTNLQIITIISKMTIMVIRCIMQIMSIVSIAFSVWFSCLNPMPSRAPLPRPRPPLPTPRPPLPRCHHSHRPLRLQQPSQMIQALLWRKSAPDTLNNRLCISQIPATAPTPDGTRSAPPLETKRHR